LCGLYCRGCCFVDDTLFITDYGTARCYFPGEDAKILYQSIQKILSISTYTQLFTDHGYKSPDRDFYPWESTVAVQKNIRAGHLGPVSNNGL